MPDRLPASVTTVAEAFRAAGYATFATSSVPFTGKLTNLHQGLEVLHERPSIEDLDGTSAKTARTFVDRLLLWIEAHQDVPFFAFLHVFDPHSPFEPAEPLLVDVDGPRHSRRVSRGHEDGGRACRGPIHEAAVVAHDGGDGGFGCRPRDLPRAREDLVRRLDPGDGRRDRPHLRATRGAWPSRGHDSRLRQRSRGGVPRARAQLSRRPISTANTPTCR